MKRVKLPPVPRPKVKLSFHYILLHVALLVFCCDMLAVIWPDFEKVWKTVARVGVALAALLACLAEYFEDDVEEEVKKIEKEVEAKLKEKEDEHG